MARERGVGDDTEELLRQLADVQTQLAFQEDTVSALNEALARQQQEILVLRRQVELLKQRQDEQTAQLDPGAAGAQEEKPPHY
jgi:SlyX protein